MSNYGVSTTTRARDYLPHSLKLNRISLDSRKSNKNSFTRKTSNKADNDRYAEQKFLVWSEKETSPSNTLAKDRLKQATSNSTISDNEGIKDYKPTNYYKNLTISTPVTDLRKNQTRQGIQLSSLTTNNLQANKKS